MDKKQVSFSIPWPNLAHARAFARKWLVPSPGSVLFTVLAIGALLNPLVHCLTRFGVVSLARLSKESGG